MAADKEFSIETEPSMKREATYMHFHIPQTSLEPTDYANP